jgi:hypothetical protein
MINVVAMAFEYLKEGFVFLWSRSSKDFNISSNIFLWGHPGKFLVLIGEG